MYKVWCEWDVGQEDLVFTTSGVALKWLLENENLRDCYEGGNEGLDAINELIDGGFVTIEALTVIDE